MKQPRVNFGTLILWDRACSDCFGCLTLWSGAVLLCVLTREKECKKGKRRTDIVLRTEKLAWHLAERQFTPPLPRKASSLHALGCQWVAGHHQIGRMLSSVRSSFVRFQHSHRRAALAPPCSQIPIWHLHNSCWPRAYVLCRCP